MVHSFSTLAKYPWSTDRMDETVPSLLLCRMPVSCKEYDHFWMGWLFDWNARARRSQCASQTLMTQGIRSPRPRLSSTENHFYLICPHLRRLIRVFVVLGHVVDIYFPSWEIHLSYSDSDSKCIRNDTKSVRKWASGFRSECNKNSKCSTEMKLATGLSERFIENG